jgi:DNA-binding MarR family transcriptional regulator
VRGRAGTEKLDRFVVGWALTRAQRELQAALDSGLASLATTISQICVLHEINATPAASNVELARRTFQTPQSLGELLMKMHQRGLLERRPGEGRRLVHSTTKAGARLYRSGLEQARKIHAEVLAGLDDRKLESLMTSFRTIAEQAIDVRTSRASERRTDSRVTNQRVAETAPSGEVDRFLVGWALTRAQRELQVALDGGLASLRITISQVCVLHEINGDPVASNVALARRTFQTPQSLGELLMKMHQRGLLERRPGEGRRLEHSTTGEGARLYRMGLEQARSIHDEVLAGFDDQELVSLNATLCSIADQARHVNRRIRAVAR